MDERRLRYFLAVAEEQGVTRAAHRLRVAQPSLSQALRALEQDVGAELFHRTRQGMRLTAAGTAFAGHARHLLRAIDEARKAVTDVEELRSGAVEIAALPTLGLDPVATLAGRFRERHPQVRLDVFAPDGPEELTTLVTTGVCEIGVTHLPVGGQGLVTHVLGEQELVFVLPRKLSPRSRGPLAPHELAEVPFIAPPPGTSTRALLEHALAVMGVTPRIAVQTAVREAIVPLVLAGAGAALLPAFVAEQAARRGATVRSAQPAITRSIGIIHRSGQLSAGARAFLAIAEVTVH